MMCGICGCGDSPVRREHLELDLLHENDRHARTNRARLKRDGICALNLVSSPGAGKTTLLVRTLETLHPRRPCRVIEGDQRTELDARRIRATGVPVLQINTGKACHLEADQVGRAIDTLTPPPGALLFIENVGNLVCPAAFDLGEHQRVVLLSVTEGEDKPLKYPELFRTADLLLITKIDLLPHLDFDLERCLDHAHRIHPDLPALTVSARTGEGMTEWYHWLEEVGTQAA